MSNLASVLISIWMAATSLVVCQAQASDYARIGESCIQEQEPKACMESYGYACHDIRSRSLAPDAFKVGCNLELSNQQSHFVQIFYNDGQWNVEVEKTSIREPDQFTVDPIAEYLRGEMKAYRNYSNGTASIEPIQQALYFEVGAQKPAEQILVRALCAVIFQESYSEKFATATKKGCEKQLLSRMRRLSQSEPTGPFRVAPASAIKWQSTVVTLDLTDSALVFDGRYSFPLEHKICMNFSGCCSIEGVLYLESCRAPQQFELDAVKWCLTQGLETLSTEYFSCLRSKDVKAGCERQQDDSLLCY